MLKMHLDKGKPAILLKLKGALSIQMAQRVNKISYTTTKETCIHDIEGVGMRLLSFAFY